MRSNEVSSEVGISESVVRKYSLALERKGYVFKKDEFGGRYYSKYDQETLEMVRSLTQQNRYTVGVATEMVAGKRKTVATIEEKQTDSPLLEEEFDYMQLKNHLENTRQEFNKIKDTIKSFEDILEVNLSLLQKLGEAKNEVEMKSNENAYLEEKLRKVISILQ